MPHDPTAPLHYLRNGSGTPLVLLHGYLGGAAQWQTQLQQLGPDFDVIAPEYSGYGSSFAATACDSIAGYAVQVLALLDHLGVQEFLLLGHSMGGMVAQQIAASVPDRVRGLVCYGTGPIGIMPNRYEPIETSRQRMHSEGVQVSARRISAKWFVDGAAHPQHLATSAHGENVSLDTALAGLQAMEHWDGRDNLVKIHAPTLVLWGDQDRSYKWPQPEALWRGIKHTNLAVMPGCSHAAHVENPTLFLLLLQQFLRPLGEYIQRT